MSSLGKRHADEQSAGDRTDKKRRRDDGERVKEKKEKREKGDKELKEKKDKKDKKEKKEKKDKKEKKEKKEKSVLPTPQSGSEAPSGNVSSDDEPVVSPPSSSSSAGYVQAADLTALPQSSIDSFLSEHTVTIEDRTTSTSTPPLRPLTKFAYLPTYPGVRPGFFDSFKAPTSIQAVTWPYLLSGRDVVGIAETGSGKTLAFGLPCIRDVAADVLSAVTNDDAEGKRRGGKGKKNGSGPSVKAVIMSPTRELAIQIHQQLDNLADHSAGIHVACLYGGAPKDEQREALKRASVAIGTPGRLKDILSEDPSRFGQVRYVVLDEADRMLDKGFEEEIASILKLLPKSTDEKPRQTVMFTATWPSSIQKLAGSYMRSPVKITVGQLGDPDAGPRANLRISQSVEVMDPSGKDSRLLQLLRDHEKATKGKKDQRRVLVFCLYKKEASRVEGNLKYRGIAAGGIHGDMNQSARLASLAAFKDGSVPVLVATDVAARGLDIPDVGLVINVTFPLTIEDYVHRIGRYVPSPLTFSPSFSLSSSLLLFQKPALTIHFYCCRTGRAGKDGKAITFFTDHDKALAGSLVNVLNGANQPVPDALVKFGTTVKKKEHGAYGAFYRDTSDAKAATRITFD